MTPRCIDLQSIRLTAAHGVSILPFNGPRRRFRLGSTAFTLAAIIAILASAAAAENPLSQLDFDTAPVAQDAPKSKQNDINAILNDPDEPAPAAHSGSGRTNPSQPASTQRGKSEVDQNSKTPGTAKGASTISTGTPPAVGSVKPSATSAVQTFDWVRPEDAGVQFLVPLLKGPETDQGELGRITSRNGWKREGTNCADVKSQEGLCSKAKAVRELFRRFSGTDDFYSQQCSQICSDPALDPVLTGFAVKGIKDGEFQIFDDNKTCRYRVFVRGTIPHWQVLQGERGTCSCLPSSCLAESNG